MAWCRQAKSHSWANVDPDLCHQMASLGLNELNLNSKMVQAADIPNNTEKYV